MAFVSNFITMCISVEGDMWTTWYPHLSLLLSCILAFPKLWIAWRILSMKAQISTFNSALAISFAVYGKL